jgi:PhnB protein
MHVVPYLNFDGTCREAFEFYHQVLGGDPPEMVTIDDMPMDNAGDDWKDRILHARLEFSGQVIMGSDTPPGGYSTPQGISVSLQLSDVPEGEQIFTTLSEGGTIQMPWEQQPWGAMFGMVTDRYGIPWMINCE